MNLNEKYNVENTHTVTQSRVLCDTFLLKPFEINAAFNMQDEIGDSRIIKAPALRSFPCHVGVGTDAVASVGSIVAIAA